MLACTPQIAVDLNKEDFFSLRRRTKQMTYFSRSFSSNSLAFNQNGRDTVQATLDWIEFIDVLKASLTIGAARGGTQGTSPPPKSKKLL